MTVNKQTENKLGVYELIQEYLRKLRQASMEATSANELHIREIVIVNRYLDSGDIHLAVAELGPQLTEDEKELYRNGITPNHPEPDKCTTVWFTYSTETKMIFHFPMPASVAWSYSQENLITHPFL